MISFYLDWHKINKRFLQNFSQENSCIFKNFDFIKINGSGDPLENPDFIDFLRIFDFTYMPQVFFHTDGSFLNEKKIKIISSLKGKINISFSIDASSNKLFKKIRSNYFEKIVDAIEKISRDRIENRLCYPKITASFSIIRENLEDTIDFIKFSRKIGTNKAYFFSYDCNNSPHFYPCYFKDSIKNKNDNNPIFPDEITDRLNLIKEYAQKSGIEITAGIDSVIDSSNEEFKIVIEKNLLNYSNTENYSYYFKKVIDKENFAALNLNLKTEKLKKIEDRERKNILLSAMSLIFQKSNLGYFEKIKKQLLKIFENNYYLSGMITVMKFQHIKENNLSSSISEEIEALEKIASNAIFNIAESETIYRTIAEASKNSNLKKYYIYKMKELTVKLERQKDTSSINEIISFLKDSSTIKFLLDQKLNIASSNQEITEIQKEIQEHLMKNLFK